MKTLDAFCRSDCEALQGRGCRESSVVAFVAIAVKICGRVTPRFGRPGMAPAPILPLDSGFRLGGESPPMS
jgi:hypothetical protein